METKQETIERLQKQIEEKDKTIADFGQKFAKLADQAQQLNLVDKPRLLHKDKDDEENVSNVNKETETEKQEEKIRRGIGFISTLHSKRKSVERLLRRVIIQH